MAQSFPGGGGQVVIESVATEHIKRAGIEERLSALSTGLMGDVTDGFTGSTSFSHVDISIPGNSELEVAVRRKRELGYPFYHLDAVSKEIIDLAPGGSSSLKLNKAFSDWSLDVPYISIDVVGEISWRNTCSFLGGCNQTAVYSLAQNQTRDFCSNEFIEPIYVVTSPQLKNGPNLNFIADLPHESVTSGFSMNIPGEGSQRLLYNPKGEQWPNDAHFVTKSGWTISCGQMVDEVRHLTANAPDGRSYEFTQMTARSAKALRIEGAGPDTQFGGRLKPWGVFAPKLNVILLGTEARDKNDNWVRHSYDDDGWLTDITSNDDRTISVNYDTLGRVTSVTSGAGPTARSINYAYRDAGSNRYLLSSVMQPDGTSWGFDTTISVEANSESTCKVSDKTWVFTHPNGTVGSFKFTEIGLRGVKSGNLKKSVCGQPSKRVLGQRPDTMALKMKTLNIVGSPTSTWTYTYNVNVSSENSQTVVTDSLGQKTVSEYNNETTQLIRTETKNAFGQTLKKIDYTYVLENPVGDMFAFPPLNEWTVRHENPSRLTKTVTTQDGDTYTSESSYNTNQSSPDYSFGRPTSNRSYSNRSPSTAPRGTDIEYEHNTSEWILGLPKRTYEVSSTGARREMSSYVYNDKGQKTSQKRYGQDWADFTYHADGNVKSVTDALGRRTEAHDWYRGTPQKIISAVGTPDEIETEQTVNYNGWLTSQTDAKNQTTTYNHDIMGRLTQITPPGSWAPTHINYDFPSSGGAVQTITKGQGKTTVTYDSMLRTTLEQTQALDTGWSSYVNTEYDALGRAIFKSQPSTNPNETKGVETTYDGLGRVYNVTENVAPYAKTEIRYLSGHRKSVKHPYGSSWTTYYSYGYDGPGNTDYRAIYKYADAAYHQKTYLTKNEWGQLTRLRQWGDKGGYAVDHSQDFEYDAQQRLCRHYVPEHGASKYQYDAAGQMTAYAKGQDNSGCGTAPNSSDRVAMTYDALGRMTRTDFADGATPSITREYDDNGNVLTVNRGTGNQAVNWTYAYNELDLLTSEKLDVDGRNYDSAYRYNPLGHLNYRKTPSGRWMNIAKDGLGRDLRVSGWGSAHYVSGITYHASGAVQDMDYRNGYEYSQILNDRLLPERISAYRGNTAAVDLTYTYDVRGLIETIADMAVANNNRYYAYDGVGYLKTASGSWGVGHYKYDSLGNLREKTLGARSVTLNYDEAKNRLNQSMDTGASGTRTVDYDARGNVTTLGNLAFLYDKSDQPVTVTGSANGVGAANGNYRYDGNLKRVKSVVNGKTIYNVYDASGGLIYVHKLAHGGEPEEKIDYIKAAGMSVARINYGVNTTYLHPDHLGSAQAGTTGFSYSDPWGTVAWREQYTPFGEEIQGQSANADLDGFTGHIKDSATGLNYMQARYYDPVIGRFLSVDPVTFMDTGNPTHFNRYAYCGSNPLNCTDPTGMVGVNLDPFNRPPPTREQAINQIAGTLLAIEVGLIAADIAALGPTGEGIVPAIGVRAAREGFETAMQRGVRKEADTLADMGLKKNTQKVSSPEGNSIPDALTDAVSVEVKDTKSVCCSKQVRIQTDAAKASGRESVLVTGTKTKVNDNAEAAFDRIIRRDDLGPQE